MIFKKTTLVLTALLVAIAFSGCSKKPRRPNPLDTVMGQGSSGYGNDGSSALNPAFIGGSGSDILPESRNAGFGPDAAERARRNVLPTVFFSFDSSSITPQERSKLDEAAAYLNQNSNAKLILEGHCDWRGTSEYNLALGDRRSKSVESYLQNLGVSSSRLQTLSKGDLNATEGASSAQMSKERKVELLVLD